MCSDWYLVVNECVYRKYVVVKYVVVNECVFLKYVVVEYVVVNKCVFLKYVVIICSVYMYIVVFVVLKIIDFQNIFKFEKILCCVYCVYLCEICYKY